MGGCSALAHGEHCTSHAPLGASLRDRAATVRQKDRGHICRTTPTSNDAAKEEHGARLLAEQQAPACHAHVAQDAVPALVLPHELKPGGE